MVGLDPGQLEKLHGIVEEQAAGQAAGPLRVKQPLFHLVSQGLGYVSGGQAAVPRYSVNEAVVPSEGADFVVGHRFQPLLKGTDSGHGRDDVGPAHVDIYVGEHLGQAPQHMLIGIADMEDVEAYPGILQE